jgi:hypothetical protein
MREGRALGGPPAGGRACRAWMSGRTACHGRWKRAAGGRDAWTVGAAAAWLKERKGWKLGFDLYIYELDSWAEQASELASSCLDGPELCLVGPLFRIVFVLALRVEIAAQTRVIIVSCRH